jgi:hypothetical protein
MAKQKTSPETAQTAAETAAGQPQTDTPDYGGRGRRKTRIGVVASDKSAKTVTVVV